MVNAIKKEVSQETIDNLVSGAVVTVPLVGLGSLAYNLFSSADFSSLSPGQAVGTVFGIAITTAGFFISLGYVADYLDSAYKSHYTPEKYALKK